MRLILVQDLFRMFAWMALTDSLSRDRKLFMNDPRLTIICRSEQSSTLIDYAKMK